MIRQFGQSLINMDKKKRQDVILPLIRLSLLLHYLFWVIGYNPGLFFLLVKSFPSVFFFFLTIPGELFDDIVMAI